MTMSVVAMCGSNKLTSIHACMDFAGFGSAEEAKKANLARLEKEVIVLQAAARESLRREVGPVKMKGIEHVCFIRLCGSEVLATQWYSADIRLAMTLIIVSKALVNVSIGTWRIFRAGSHVKWVAPLLLSQNKLTVNIHVSSPDPYRRIRGERISSSHQKCLLICANQYETSTSCASYVGYRCGRSAYRCNLQGFLHGCFRVCLYVYHNVYVWNLLVFKTVANANFRIQSPLNF